MKNKKSDVFTNLALDPEEKKINDAVEQGIYKEIDNLKTEKARIAGIFKEATKKDKRISIRVNGRDLHAIRVKAAQNMLSYQTLISIILHRFAQGKVDIRL